MANRKLASRSPDGWLHLLSSWSTELLSTTERINDLLGDLHKLTKGEYLESLLRHLLRRVLPNRFRVSTGFIYRFGQPPSRQLDIVVWDAQEHAALLEEGEFAVLELEAVAAVIEVKATLTPAKLSDALDLLCPPWMISWPYAPRSSLTAS